MSDKFASNLVREKVDCVVCEAFSYLDILPKDTCRLSSKLNGLSGITSDGDKCPDCARSVPFHARFCPYCEASVGFPNVRKADSEPEVQALEERLEIVRDRAVKNDSVQQLNEFENAVAMDSVAVMARPMADVLTMLETGRLYTSFHNGITSGARVAQDNVYDRGRGSVDALMFPEYAEKINFALLSFGPASDYYGDIFVTIRPDAIATRASVFHENSFEFVQSRKITVGSEIPAGFRATWGNRGKLAAAKLGGEIDQKTDYNSFPDLLLHSKDDGAQHDFIEVHIYGNLLGEAIQAIHHAGTGSDADMTVIRSAIRKAQQKGIELDIELG